MVTTPDPASVAATVVQLALDGRFTELEELFAPRLSAVVSAETVRIGWTGELSRTGPVIEVGEPATEPPNDGLVVVGVPLVCERGELTLRIAVDDAGMLHGLRLTSPASSDWRAPGYAAPRRFSELEVRIGTGSLSVPGTLTMPRRRGLHPGVVLLSGGGMFDRDESFGVNKPFKDLAWGLASRGIAVARFDKVTFVRGEAASEPGFTVIDEYLEPAVAAVQLLQTQPGVDPERVFIAGHSLGGRVAPRIAAAEPSIAGLVILAGDTSPQHRAVVRVARHIAAVSPETIPEAALDALEKQAALAGDPDLSPATSSAALPFNWSASYWLDLREYDPVATAVIVERPMLILQGARDYQVTVADDLTGWQAGLAHRPDVTLRIYESADHLFFRGTGPSTPAGYEPPQHVDPIVVKDIAAWLRRQSKSPRRP